MEDDFVSSPSHSRTPRSAGARAFFARLTDAAKAVGSVAASASELLTDKELRRKGAGYIMSEASRGIQGIQKGIESSAEAVGRTARQRLEVGSKSVQNVLKNIERQVSEFQRQQQLHDKENELDHYRKLPVDIQIGEQVYEDMPQEMRSRLWYALLERPELAHPFRPVSGPKHLGSRSSSRMHSHVGGSDAPLSRGSSGTSAGACADAANLQHAQQGEQQEQQQGQTSEEQQQRQEQHQTASAVGVSGGAHPVVEPEHACRADVAEPSSSEPHATVGQPPAQSTSSASQHQLHAQQAASAIEQQTQGAANSSDAQPAHAVTSDSASAPEAAQALNSAQLAESASGERAAERTVSSIPDIDDLLAHQPSSPVSAVEQPSPTPEAHSDISGHAASTAASAAAGVASGQLPCVATAAEHPSGAAAPPSSTTLALEDGVTGRDASGSSASSSNASGNNASNPASTSLLGYAANESGSAHSAGSPQSASGAAADSKQAEGALPPPSATQVLEAASQDEWQAAAAARAAAAGADGLSQQQGSASSSLAGSQNTAADDSFTGVSSGMLSVGDEAAAAEAPAVASTSAGLGAVDTRHASPARAGKRVTLNTPFQDSSSSEPASSPSSSAQQGTGSSSGAGSSHADSSGVGSSGAAGRSSNGSGHGTAISSGAGSSGVGRSSRQPPGTRVSDGGDTEWEVVSKDALPVLSTSGEVEALETVKSIVQSLSDKDELDRLRASKAALFQAMLEVPWLPGEGIPREYDEQCPYALLLRMDSPGGTECVDEVIQRDIHRTFPEHPLFSEAGGQAGGQQRLYRLLRAYACRDAEVGYCQGMAFAAGVLLMYLPEEPAFRLFCRLMEPFGPNLRRLYLPGLDPLKAELSRFELLLATHLPALHEHLLAAGLPAVLYASQWLMTIYAAPFPVHFAARLIDIMLLEGNDNVLPRIALSIMEAMSEELLALDDFEALITHLKVKPLQWKVHKYRQVIASAIDSHVSDSELEAAAAAVAAEGVRLGRPPSFRGAALQRRTTTGGGSFHTLAPLGEVQGSDGDELTAGPSSAVAEAGRVAVAAPSSGHEVHQGSAAGSDRALQPPLLGAEAELAALQAAEMAELDAAFMDMMIEADLLLPGGTFGPSRDPSETDEAGAAHVSA